MQCKLPIWRVEGRLRVEMEMPSSAYLEPKKVVEKYSGPEGWVKFSSWIETHSQVILQKPLKIKKERRNSYDKPVIYTPRRS